MSAVHACRRLAVRVQGRHRGAAGSDRAHRIGYGGVRAGHRDGHRAGAARAMPWSTRPVRRRSAHRGPGRGIDRDPRRLGLIRDRHSRLLAPPARTVSAAWQPFHRRAGLLPARGPGGQRRVRGAGHQRPPTMRTSCCTSPTGSSPPRPRPNSASSRSRSLSALLSNDIGNTYAGATMLGLTDDPRPGEARRADSRRLVRQRRRQRCVQLPRHGPGTGAPARRVDDAAVHRATRADRLRDLHPLSPAAGRMSTPDVAIIGVGQTTVGEHWDRSLRDLAVEALLSAIQDAGSPAVASLFVGNMMAGELTGQEHLGALVADFAGLGASRRCESKRRADRAPRHSGSAAWRWRAAPPTWSPSSGWRR